MKSRQPTRGERRGGAWRDEQGERRGVRCRRRSNIEADEIRLNHARFKPDWRRYRYEILCEFFNAMVSSIQLLRLKRPSSTFMNKSPKIESLTDGKLYSLIGVVRTIEWSWNLSLRGSSTERIIRGSVQAPKLHVCLQGELRVLSQLDFFLFWHLFTGNGVLCNAEDWESESMIGLVLLRDGSNS
ncbi:hypothetical protein Dimus_002585 [Dionaea muscipula]